MPSRYGEITKEFLSVLAETGKIILTGNSVEFGLKKWRSYSYSEHPKDRERRKKFSQALWRLKQSRLAILQEKEDGTFIVELTEKGKRKVQEFQFAELKIAIPKKWDGLWRIVVFDIPEKRKQARDALRWKLKELNFYQIQKSVWVYPYPCEKEIDFIIELFHVYPFVNIIIGAEIKDDVKIRKHFDLL